MSANGKVITNSGKEREAQIVVASGIIYKTFGVWPSVNRTAEYDELYFTPEQEEIAENTIIRFLEQDKKGTLKIQLWPVIRGAVAKKYSPYIFASGVALLSYWMFKK